MRTARVRRTVPTQWVPSAYNLFLMGKDTLAIAKVLGTSEEHAHKALSVERSRSKGLASPYDEVPT